MVGCRCFGTSFSSSGFRDFVFLFCGRRSRGRPVEDQVSKPLGNDCGGSWGAPRLEAHAGHGPLDADGPDFLGRRADDRRDDAKGSGKAPVKTGKE